jgi:hypothetical protein
VEIQASAKRLVIVTAMARLAVSLRIESPLFRDPKWSPSGQEDYQSMVKRSVLQITECRICRRGRGRNDGVISGSPSGQASWLVGVQPRFRPFGVFLRPDAFGDAHRAPVDQEPGRLGALFPGPRRGALFLGSRG